jgi:hypothetical protein
VPDDPEEEHMSDDKSKKRAEYEGDDEPDVEAHIFDEPDGDDTTSKKKKRSEGTGDDDFDRAKKKK